MKFLVAIGVFVFCAQSTLASFIANCTDTKERIEELTYIHNGSRIMVANEFQIANMYEMKYDPSLAKYAKELKSCEDLKHGANFRVQNFADRSSLDLMKSWVQKTSKTSKNKTFLVNYERDNPIQTGFINCHLTTICTQKFIKDGELKETVLNLIDITIIGPRGTFTEADLKYGPPGSQCPHGKAKDGLCAIGSGSDSESGDGNGDSKTGNGGQADESAQSIGSVQNSMTVFFLISMILTFLNV